jgi:hypothetical protein
VIRRFGRDRLTVCIYAHCGLLVMFDSLGLDIVAGQDLSDLALDSGHSIGWLAR